MRIGKNDKRARLRVEMMNIRDITPYENNPRINEPAVEAVEKSIADFGFVNPIIVDENCVILCGHTRYIAANNLGMSEIQAIRICHLDEKKKKAFRIADNKVGELSEWDYDALCDELRKIGGIDMSAYFEDILTAEELFDERKKINCPNCGGIIYINENGEAVKYED